MDYKFLDKVLGQIVRETRMDYDGGWLYTPFSPFFPPSSLSLLPFYFPHFLPFSQHCEEVYGLNIEEIVYVWKQYKEIILDKINNG